MAQYFTVHPTHPQPRLIREAAEIVRDGGVIAYPTDSSYALGCHIGDALAARRIRQIRGVGDDHFLTLVLRDLAEIGRFAKLDNWQFRIIRRGTPGRYTFVVPATREVPRRLQHPKRRTVGVRVPDHAVAQALLAELNEPILSSTLILPGADAPLNDVDAIRDSIGARIDLVIDAGACPAEPTTVVDLGSAPGVIVRQGAGDPVRLGL
jgi:tRNA threonylcarbamoyl adenosine modification protein (Sua5/YciO/YrdC/YwlC family)